MLLESRRLVVLFCDGKRHVLIVHVITRLLRAGSEENTIATCLAQSQAGHHVILVHGNEWNPVHREHCGTAIEFIEIPEMVHQIDVMNDLRAIGKMRALFRQRRPTVVHTHQSKAGIIGRVAARLAGVPVIVHGVHILPFIDVGLAKKLIYLTCERSVAGFTDAFISVSEGMRQTCLDHALGKPEQHFVARSGMDVARFRSAPPPADWRRMVQIDDAEEKPPIILMLAALEARKRHVEFIRVFKRVVDQVPQVRLLVAGEGTMRAAIAAEVASLGLERQVRLLGFQPQPECLIALADFTVLTSMREGLPRVIVQSLAGGRPVVTTRLPGIEEIVRTGVNGLVTSADDLTETADAVARLLLDRQRLRLMQSEAAHTDVSPWSVETMCHTISHVYERLLQQRGLRP